MISIRKPAPVHLRWIACLTMALVVFGILAVSAETQNASAAVPASSAPFAEIQNYNSGLCVEAHGASTKAGLELDQWGCRGATNELWRFYLIGSSTYQIYQENDLECLAVNGSSTANNAPIIQTPCTRGSPTPNEEWSVNLFIGNMNGLSYYEWYNLHSGKCLNVADASKASGADIIQFTCEPTAKNEFFAQPFVS
jgi:hypothetical protein